MKKSIYLSIYFCIFFLSISLNSQSINSQALENGESIKRNATYNLEEIKVRWKKAALENCVGVPCNAFTCGSSTISDIDGNSYNTALIGTQCWTRENLKVTKYNDGSLIPDSTSSTWGTAAIGARTGYVAAGVSNYVGTFGYLYNWYAATDSRKICPVGWHVPTDSEWNSLIQFIHPTASVNVTGPQSNTAGGNLKSTSTLWSTVTPPSPGTDNYGFSALPGGLRNLTLNFFGISGISYFWSTGEFIPVIARMGWVRSLDATNSIVLRIPSDKTTGASVRCLKD
jgi:uncharacterized protein (TIGR02145 family)